MSDIFDFTGEGALNATTQENTGSVYFNPKPADGKEYVVQLRLLPFMKDPKNSIVSIRHHWFEDAAGGFKMFSPTRPDTKCEVTNVFFNFWKKDPKHVNCGILRSQQTHGVLVQIKNDLTNPENNGKIMPYKLPVKVYQMVEAALNPSEDDIKLGKTPKDMLNPFNGYDITLKVKKTSEGRNYDATEIAATPTSMFIDGNPVTVEQKDTVVTKLTAIAEEFDINDIFGYKAPSAEDLIRTKKIVVEQCGQDPTIFMSDIAYTPAGGSHTQQPQAPAAPSEPAAPAAPSASTTEAPTQTPTGSDSVDDIVNQAMQS